jgi:Carboxypeptidase regulatory-like domain
MHRIMMLAGVCVLSAFSQVTTSLLDGTVTDPGGGVVAGAEITVTNADNGQVLRMKSDERGHWALPAMIAGEYKVAVSAAGFRGAAIDGVKIDAGVPKTVNVKLEVGSVTETVEVAASGELLQTTSATIASTVQQRQVKDLPFISRGGMDLLVTQPGVQTGTTNRTSFINGLPLAALNVTIDGINTQDNYYKNGDGFFTLIPARQDALEEITLSTSATGVDANAQGAATVKFITKGGTNTLHGGVFWQHRNTDLDANSYFNNINGLQRNKVILNQGGFNVGGPIKKNRLFFFTNYEIYRYPAQTTTTRVVMTPDAMTGNFTYPVTGGTVTRNVLQLAGAGGFPASIDPIIGQTLNQINGYTKNGTLQDRKVSNSDYDRNNLLFQPKGISSNWVDTTRLDYNITSKHALQVVYTYSRNTSSPDITNNVVPVYPGTGAVIGADSLIPSQGGVRYAVAAALRSSLTASLTNELRFGVNRSVTIFRGEVASPALFSEWKGYCPTLGFTLTNVSSVCGSSRRVSPVRELHDTMSKQKGSHIITFGADISQINLWYQTVGTSVIPTISFSGLANNDPVGTGATSIFTTANFPGATATQLSDAGSLYSLLTGRVVSIGRSKAFDGTSYKSVPPTERDRQYEYGLFVQDSWRVASNLTVTAGLRFEQQRPFQNLDGVYSAVSYASLWGISGVGHLFQPGASGGVNPTFDRYNGSYYKVPNMWNPSAGLAWRIPGTNGPAAFLLGRDTGKAVLRAGYAISTVRNGSYTFQNLLGSNQGLNYDATVNATSYPQDFGAPGSVLFSSSTLPTRSGVPNSPQYPITPTLTNSLNGYDPNLKMSYVQSWNIGLQRELTKNTVMEVRYTGNHGIKEWRQVDLNEVNLFENGFLKEFYTAQSNLFIARGCKTSWNDCANPSAVGFGNAGLAGQGNIPLIQTGLNYNSDTTVATYLRQNRPGNVAGLMYNNAAAMSRLTAAGYPANLFVVNPAVAGGGAFLLTNGGYSNYNALQVEVNRRLSSGVLMQGSYVWAHSLVNGSQSSLVDFNQPTTLRGGAQDKVPGSYDIHHTFKVNGVYELPFGPNKRFLAGGNPFVRKVVGGWQISGISRIQSGAPFQLTSGRAGMDYGVDFSSTNGTMDTGVVLNNMTTSQLQSMVHIRKTTGANGIGQVMYLPDSLIANTNAAFELNGKTWSNLDYSAPYIGPQLAPNSYGYKVFLYNPWQYHLDLAAKKLTNVGEKIKTELQVSFLDALNLTNFFIANGPSSTSFGRTTSAYNDFAGSADPGSRLIEFRLRVSF